VFPNPQDALPLPLHPSLQQYRKLAKDLVKACRSGDRDGIGGWADRWIGSLGNAVSLVDHPRDRRWTDRVAGQIEDFATRELKAAGSPSCVLADAQFVIARSHGFESWPKFVACLDRLAHAGSDVAAFETAADAIVAGDEAALRRLIAAGPALVHARSTREHRATLLHYVSANGVEGYRQRTPENIASVAEILLEAGAEVDAEADVYGGGSTTLGLVATSAHPRIAGVQNRLMQVLIDHGARIEQPGIAGHGQGVVMSCLANGCPEAAAYLAERGARLGLVEAAGVGRLDVVKTSFDPQGDPKTGVGRDLIHTAFRYACFYGRDEVVAFLVGRGVDLAGHDGDGQTGLHYAAMGGRLDTVKLLLRHNAPLEALNRYGGTVLSQALWTAAHGGGTDVYVPIVKTLIAAGAKVDARHPPVNAEVDAVLARHGSVTDDALSWYGEGPRKRRA
jgi:hypothetical protein